MSRIVLIFLVTLIMGVLLSAAQKPAFEVASVKPNSSVSGPARISSGPDGSLRAINTTLRLLILQAYGVFDYQLVGRPDWLDTARFDVEGKAASGIDNRNVLEMLQSLLEDRFKLKVHRETRELPVFILTAAKGGSKLQPAFAGRSGLSGLGPGASRTNVGPAGGELSGNGIGTAKLIDMLVRQVGRPIIDKTSLTGTYDFILKFAPQPTNAGLINVGDAISDPSGPSIFTALTEQLGLRLESGRGPVEVLVIDHAEKPSEN